jgi:hypothetical protein
LSVVLIFRLQRYEEKLDIEESERLKNTKKAPPPFQMTELLM